MNAGEVRKLLEGVPDESPVVSYDSDYGMDAATVEVVTYRTAAVRTTWAAGSRRFLEHVFPSPGLAALGFPTALNGTVPLYRTVDIPEVVEEQDVELEVDERWEERLAAATVTGRNYEGRMITRELLGLSEPFVRVEVTQD